MSRLRIVQNEEMILTCDNCGNEARPRDLDVLPTDIVRGGMSWRADLCRACYEPLRKVIEEGVPAPPERGSIAQLAEQARALRRPRVVR